MIGHFQTKIVAMDYDTTEIAASYDLGRSHGPEVLGLWMSTISAYLVEQTVTNILDLGCGTGRFSAALAAHFDAQLIGLDPSIKMLEQARSKDHDPRTRFELGYAGSIPLPDNSVDLIFMSMIYHHLNDPRLAARECRRVLRQGGTAFLRAGVRERISSYPYVDFFPSSRPVLENLLPTCSDVTQVFEAAGFRTAVSDVVTQEVAPSLQRYAEKLAAGADSVLASLSQSDFDSGMEALRSSAARAEEEPVLEPIDFFVFK
jgi:ubiquinone/menaquinone biosynthesis C-methylase UbiE